MNPNKLWDAAIHEAAHLVVYVKAGGTAKRVTKLSIYENGEGAICTPYINQFENPTVADAAITAAGIACEQIRGLEPCTGHGSDTNTLHDILWNDAQEQLTITMTRRWLEANWHHVERAAQRLVDAPKSKGRVPHRAVREIVEELARQLHPYKSIVRRRPPSNYRKKIH